MKRTNAAANAVISYAPLAVVAFLVIVTNPMMLILTVAFIYMLGLAKLIRSKMSLFRQHHWLSFGPSKMDTENRTRYFQGYATIVVAAVFNLLGIALTGLWS